MGLGPRAEPFFLNYVRGLQQERAARTGQLDLSMMSPGMLSVLLSTQEEKRRRRPSRRHASTLITGGMGLANEPRRAGKTLLGQ